MSLRSRAREVVLQILYQDDLNQDRNNDTDLAFIKNRLHNNGNIIDFAEALLNGVRAKSDQIDAELGAVTKNWKVNRMAATDRNVLRLGAFEILFYDTPARVACNEAIELAKRYGDELSPNFINGILDRLIQKTEPGQAESSTGTDEESVPPQELPVENNQPDPVTPEQDPNCETAGESDTIHN
jgi:N utilization substance protein B